VNMKQDVLRRCALTLHSLSAADREWMLSRLRADHARELQPMLDELRAIGMPADLDAVKAALGARVHVLPAHRHRAGADGRLPKGAVPSAQDVASVLDGEGAELIARVLQTRQTRERNAILRLLPPSRRRATLERVARDPGVGPGAEGALLQQALALELSTRIASFRARRPSGWSFAIARRWRKARIRLEAIFA